MWWIYLLVIVAYVVCGAAYFYFFVYPDRFKKDKTNWTYVSFLWPITILVELTLIIIIDNLVYKFKKNDKLKKINNKTPEEQAHYRKSAFKNDQ